MQSRECAPLRAVTYEAPPALSCGLLGVSVQFWPKSRAATQDGHSRRDRATIRVQARTGTKGVAEIDLDATSASLRLQCLNGIDHRRPPRGQIAGERCGRDGNAHGGGMGHRV
jgi:hypothetical protein